MATSQSRPVKNTGGVRCFPSKLHYVLCEMERDGQASIMSWLPDGKSFKIHCVAMLESDILPQWFRQSKFASFTRQLNIYGFTRIFRGPNKGCICHPKFLRSQPHLAETIPRQAAKKTKKATTILSTRSASVAPRLQQHVTALTASCTDSSVATAKNSHNANASTVTTGGVMENQTALTTLILLRNLQLSLPPQTSEEATSLSWLLSQSHVQPLARKTNPLSQVEMPSATVGIFTNQHRTTSSGINLTPRQKLQLLLYNTQHL